MQKQEILEINNPDFDQSLKKLYALNVINMEIWERIKNFKVKNHSSSTEILFLSPALSHIFF